MVNVNPERRRRARALACLAAVGCAVMLVSTAWPNAAQAAPTNAGPAMITDPTSHQGERPADTTLSGGSTTPFSLVLPTGAACTGDSASGGYRVQSFMVAGSVDPSALQFGATGPTPTATGANFSEPLFDTSSNPYVNQQTANATTPGGPGPIINIPAFDFAVYTPGQIPAGTYNLGIACTLGPASTTQIDHLWVGQMTVTTDTTDSPAQIHWVASPDASSSSTTSSTTSTSTTSTTIGGSSSTTSTTSGSSTTSSTDCSSTTSTALTTSSSSATTSTTAAPSCSSTTSTTSTGGTGTTSGTGSSSGSSLPNTGAQTLRLLVWAGLLLYFGRLAIVLSRPARARRSAR